MTDNHESDALAALAERLAGGDAARGEAHFSRLIGLATRTDADQEFMFWSLRVTPPDARDMLAYLATSFDLVAKMEPKTSDPSSAPQTPRSVAHRAKAGRSR